MVSLRNETYLDHDHRVSCSMTFQVFFLRSLDIVFVVHHSGNKLMKHFIDSKHEETIPSIKIIR